jgi:hypothetical protein
MERTIKRFEEFTTEEKLLAILEEVSERLDDLEHHVRARDALVAEMIKATEETYDDTHLIEAINRFAALNGNATIRIDELIGEGKSILCTKGPGTYWHGVAALRALKIWIDEQEAEKDPTYFYPTYERVAERYRGKFDGMKSLGDVVRAVVATTGDPEAKQFLEDEPEQLGD